MRIQKHSSSSASKSQTRNKNPGFGLFGSILKRLTNRSKKREIEGGDGVKVVSVKDILRWDSSGVGHRKSSSNESMKMQTKMVALEDNKSASSELSLSHSCSCNGRPSSAVWSESNEDKSLDLDSSISSQSVDLEVIEFLSKQRPETDFACCDKHFCESPFRFVLQRSPSSSSGRRTPEFQSPAASPSHHKNEVCHNAFFFFLTLYQYIYCHVYLFWCTLFWDQFQVFEIYHIIKMLCVCVCTHWTVRVDS